MRLARQSAVLGSMARLFVGDECVSCSMRKQFHEISFLVVSPRRREGTKTRKMMTMRSTIPMRTMERARTSTRARASRRRSSRNRPLGLGVEGTGEEEGASEVRVAEAEEDKDARATSSGGSSVTREQVLQSCAVTSLSLLGIGAFARGVSAAFPLAALGGDWNAALPLASDDASGMAVSACAAAMAVTLGRITLLQVWGEFAESTDRSNAQVLGALDGALDVAQVAILPALGEEVLFRGALLPAIGGMPGIAVSSVVFGALHIGGGRSAAFGVWASMVGACYGACALHTGSVAAPAAAHAMANLASAAYWKATRENKVGVNKGTE